MAKKISLSRDINKDMGANALTLKQEYELSKAMREEKNKNTEGKVVTSNGFVVDIMTPEQRRMATLKKPEKS